MGKALAYVRKAAGEYREAGSYRQLAVCRCWAREGVDSQIAVWFRRRASATRRRGRRGNLGLVGRQSAVERSIRPPFSILQLDQRALSVDNEGWPSFAMTVTVRRLQEE
eukprot:2557309-Pleurochrysis_carterae.AAC.1